MNTTDTRLHPGVFVTFWESHYNLVILNILFYFFELTYFRNWIVVGLQ